jgi:hypothetical protein
MKRLAAIAGASVTLAFAGTAHAGIYSDDLAKCLVKSTSEADRTDLILWIYEAMSDHPAVKSMSNVTPSQREAIGRRAAELLERLLLTDCRSQTVDAMRYEGATALQSSFSVLGQVAMVGLMQDKAVAADMGAISKFIDASKFAALVADVGGPNAAASQPKK